MVYSTARVVLKVAEVKLSNSCQYGIHTSRTQINRPTDKLTDKYTTYMGHSVTMLKEGGGGGQWAGGMSHHKFRDEKDEKLNLSY